MTRVPSVIYGLGVTKWPCLSQRGTAVTAVCSAHAIADFPLFSHQIVKLAMRAQRVYFWL